VIPAYNEAHRIGSTLTRVLAYLGSLPDASEVLVVDDGSTDATRSLALAAVAAAPTNVTLRVLGHAPNQGKGASVREGCVAAQGRYVLFSDADLATPIEEAVKLFAELDAGADLAIGTRVHPGGSDLRGTQPGYRRVIGRLYNALVGMLAVGGFRDTQCGFKAFRREAAHYLFGAQRLSSIVFDTEILYLARRSRLRIQQVPVRWSNIGGSRMRVTPQQGMVVLRDLLSIRLLHLGTPTISPAATQPSQR